MRRRPISVTLLACLYLAIGVIAFAAHFHGLLAHQQDAVWVEVTEFLAIVIGVFLLRGDNWARWLAILWIAFHVAISIHEPLALAIHSAFLVLIAWILFRAASRQWFRPAPNDAAA